MRHIFRKWIKRRADTIFFRIFVMFMIVLLVSVLLIWGFMGSTLQESEFQYTLRMQRYSIAQVDQQLSNYFSNIERISLSIISDDTVQKSLTTDGVNRGDLIKLISSHAFNNSIYITYMDNKGNLYTSANIHTPEKDTTPLKQSELYNEMKSTYARMAYHLDAKSLLSSTPSFSQSYVLSAGRAVRHMNLDIEPGYLFIQIFPDSLSDLLQEPLMDKKTQYILLDQKNCVVCDRNGALQKGRQIEIPIPNHEQSDADDYFLGSAELGENLYLRRNVTNNGFKILSCIPQNTVLESRNRLISALLSTMIISIGASLLLALLFSFYFSRPIMEIVQAMRRVRDGDLKAQVCPRQQDEIGELAYTFNLMTDHIQNLLEQSARDQEELKSAEINTLIHQINPHFIYNTLDNINILAQLSDDQRVSTLITELSSLLHITLSRGREKISLREELTHVGNYLHIMQLRFSELFTYDIHSDPDIEEVQIIKVILQPIAENSVLHGLSETENGGHIRVSAFRKQNDLILDVEDNGKGMTNEELAVLRSQTKEKKDIISGSAGIGLNNIYRRLALSYTPDGFEMDFSKSVLGGLQTEITIKNQF